MFYTKVYTKFQRQLPGKVVLFSAHWGMPSSTFHAVLVAKAVCQKESELMQVVMKLKRRELQSASKVKRGVGG